METVEEMERSSHEQAVTSFHELLTPPYIVRDKPKVGRNERCPCGSGKKYKKCCLPTGK